MEYPGAAVRMKEITYEKDERNAAVLEALNVLTGQDFGYDAQDFGKTVASNVPFVSTIVGVSQGSTSNPG